MLRSEGGHGVVGFSRRKGSALRGMWSIGGYYYYYYYY